MTGQSVLHNKSLVSVVIPTHNRSELLVRAVQSVVDQTHCNLEVIVVDDHSVDDVQGALARFDGAVVRYLRNERSRGAQGSRNTGILQSRGEFIAFLDDDDQWRSDKIWQQLQAIGNAAAVVCGSTSCPRRLRNFEDGPIDPVLVRQGFLLEGGTSALLARADVIRSLLFDEALGCWQDWDLLLRLVKSHPVIYLAEPMVLYNNGRHARISNEGQRMADVDREARLAVLEKHRAFLGDRWIRHHSAALLLAYVSQRPHPLREIIKATRRSGVSAVASVIGSRLFSRLFGD